MRKCAERPLRAQPLSKRAFFLVTLDRIRKKLKELKLKIGVNFMEGLVTVTNKALYAYYDFLSS